jgi:hypothetical protein
LAFFHDPERVRKIEAAGIRAGRSLSINLAGITNSGGPRPTKSARIDIVDTEKLIPPHVEGPFIIFGKLGRYDVAVAERSSAAKLAKPGEGCRG